ncbi:MAG TPA: hypothetical protein VLE96_05480 [Chlamydiales bacterium]|nr:hypothetical protein [Chlamydiales bacterium]
MSTSTITDAREKPVYSPNFQEQRYWTDAKVQKTWLGVSALLTLSGAIACSTIGFEKSPWWSIPAISLFIATGAILWHATSIIDYDNPEQLAVVRAEATKMPLMKVVEKHGWNRLFQYGILDKDQFEVAYRIFCNDLPLNNIIQNYRLIHDKIQNAKFEKLYSLPSPSEWKDKLEEETEGYSFSKILDHFHLKDLIGYDLLAPKQFIHSFDVFAKTAPVIKLLKTYERAKKELASAAESYDYERIQQFSISMPHRLKADFISEWKDKKASEIALSFSSISEALIEHNLISSEGYSYIKKAQNEYKKANQLISTARAENESHLKACEKILKQACELADKILNNHPANQQLWNSYQYERDKIAEIEREFELDKQKHPNQINELLSKKNEKISEVSNHYRQLRKIHENSLQSVRKTRDEAHELAKQQYKMTKDSLKRELDQFIQKINSELNQKLDEINRSFDLLHLFK